jgi:membrane-associated protease RseP (regulator of RpoE activity)
VTSEVTTGASLSPDSVLLSAAHVYTVMGGPRINFNPLFVHVLFGMAHGAVSPADAAVISQNGLAAAVGLGGERRLAHHMAVRVSADYLFAYTGQPDRKPQNNVRASVGLVYRFGGARTDSGVKHASDKPTSAAQPPNAEPRRVAPATPSAGMNVYALGVVVTLGRNQGAEITSEAPNGVAALAGLHVGDVINAVDGKPVKTPMELAAELANRPTGDKVRLGYMLHGAWQTEAVIVLAH